MRRREFIGLLGVAAAHGLFAGRAGATLADGARPYDFAPFGDLRIIHTCDTHAQLLPVHYREPSTNLGLGGRAGKPPHLVGDRLLAHHGIEPGTRLAHALTHMDFGELAARFGAVGGFAHLATLVRRLRAEAPGGHALHLDSGDIWQGSHTALHTRGKDMAQAGNILGIDAMTGHWEFTYTEPEIRALIAMSGADFVAQNLRATEDALFEGVEVHDEDSGHVFPPHTVKEAGPRRVAVIGQAFPYTSIANPRRFIPDWSFGIRADDLQALVDRVRATERPDLVVLLSHNGFDLDTAVAGRVTGIDLIIGGHTHDAIVEPARVGDTLVANSGASGKFVSVADISVRDGGGIGDIRFRLLPVFSNLLEPDAEMEAHIRAVRAPHEAMLSEELATAETLLYRRGNFSGTFDQVIVDALRTRLDAELALSPGFRWGPSVPAGTPVRMEDVLNVTAMTYPETYVREMTGETIKLILEDIADNLYNPDPFYQQGGDMVRVGGFTYTLEPGGATGARISGLRLDSGEPMEAGRAYKVAGWSTVGEQSPGPPVWEVVADHLRAQGRARVDKINLPRLVGITEHNGLQDYPKELLT